MKDRPYVQLLLLKILSKKKFLKNHKFWLKNRIFKKKRVEIMPPPTASDPGPVSFERADFWLFKTILVDLRKFAV